MVAPTTASTVVAPEADTRPRWNAERAHTVALGLDRLARCGYLSETQRQQLAARVRAVASTSTPDSASATRHRPAAGTPAA